MAKPTFRVANLPKEISQSVWAILVSLTANFPASRLILVAPLGLISFLL